ncbi:MAG: GH3 auxin-responsive promoter family protein [Chitinophagales bacterium]|nr:GH3 auxin-responsive promoter family protein [Chitinophagales bacterium]
MPDLKNLAFRTFLKYCYPPDFSAERSLREQQTIFREILSSAPDTALGKELKLHKVKNYSEFKKQVPITQYDFYQLYVERIKTGEQKVLTPDKVRWFGRTAGTTGGKYKLIPLTRKFIRRTQVAGTFYSLSRIHALDKTVDILTHKNFVMTGGIYETLQPSGIVVGDISAIMMKNIPLPFRTIYVPDNDLITHSSWEYKVNRVANSVSKADVGTISGVPTWHLAVLSKIKEQTPFNTLPELWKNYRIFFHGGVNFEPYRKQFEKLAGRSDALFFEAYNATEGFFGIQAGLEGGDLLLLTNSGVFYEFIPFAEYGKENAHAISLDKVKADVPYVLLVTALNGLLRYVVGDVITFTKLNPFSFRITGRTQEYINAFGEDLLLHNVVNTLMKTNEQFDTTINEYTVAPQYISVNNKGRMQFVIEFAKAPDDLNAYAAELDAQLQKENTNYAQKRSNNLALDTLEVIAAPAGTFYKWMEQKGKLGGQNKVPRLVNGRGVIEEILAICKT